MVGTGPSAPGTADPSQRKESSEKPLPKPLTKPREWSAGSVSLKETSPKYLDPTDPAPLEYQTDRLDVLRCWVSRVQVAGFT